MPYEKVSYKSSPVVCIRRGNKPLPNSNYMDDRKKIPFQSFSKYGLYNPWSFLNFTLTGLESLAVGPN